MIQVDQSIIEFIGQHHIFTLATSCNNQPWCSTCFYIYLKENNMFVFLSDKGTRHVNEMEIQSTVSGAIALETRIIGRIRGIQFSGTVTELKGDELRKGKTAYLKAFPYAIFKKTIVWGLVPDMIKMTDNRLGFGKKLIWMVNSKMS